MTENKDEDYRQRCKDLLVHILFLVTLSVVVYGTVSPYQYYYTKSIENLFIEGSSLEVGWSEVDSWSSLWTYLRGPFLDGIHDASVDEETILVYNENKLLSLPRLRQLKVSNDSCEIPSVFGSSLYNCYSGYHPDEELSTVLPFSNVYSDASSTASCRLYNPQLLTRPYAGYLANYGAGGYEQLLSRNKVVSSYILSDLQYNGWVDRATRALFLDFTVYNVNINQFAVVKLVAEFLPTGGVLTSYDVLVQKLLRYVTTVDKVIFGFEIVLVLFVLYYLVEEAMEVIIFRMRYFMDVWNVLDTMIIVQILVGFGISLYRTTTIEGLITDSETDSDTFTSFENIAYYETVYNDNAAICLFIAWMKVFKFIKITKTMRYFSTTLARCCKDILSFSLMFLIVFFAFAQLGQLLFGTVNRDFSTFLDSTYTLFRIILGDFDFLALERARNFLGPVFFISYIFLVFFILLNMFLAIINDTYSAVKGELDGEEEVTEFGEYMKRRMGALLRLCGRKKKKEEGEEGEDPEKSGARAEIELPERGGMSAPPPALRSDDEESVDSMFEDSEQRPAARNLRTQETLSSYPPWDMQSVERVPAYLRGPSYEEFKILARRVDRNDDAMGSVISKIDAVLGKLELLEKSYNTGMFPLVEEGDFPEGLEDEQTIHIPDETNRSDGWT